MVTSAAVDAWMVREGESADGRRGEVTTARLVPRSRVAAAAFFGEEVFGLDVAEEEVRIEAVAFDHEVRPRVHGLATRAHGCEAEPCTDDRER